MEESSKWIMWRLLSTAILTRVSNPIKRSQGTHNLFLLSIGICSGGHRGCSGQTGPSNKHRIGKHEPEMPENGGLTSHSSPVLLLDSTRVCSPQTLAGLSLLWLKWANPAQTFLNCPRNQLLPGSYRIWSIENTELQLGEQWEVNETFVLLVLWSCYLKSHGIT